MRARGAAGAAEKPLLPGTKLTPLLLGRALFLGAATGAEVWQPGRSDPTRVRDQGEGVFQKLGTVVWHGTASGCASLGQLPRAVPVASTRRVPAWGCSGRSIPQFLLGEGSIPAFLTCL